MVEPPTVLEQLTSPTERLMSAATLPSFRVPGPVATVVVSDRPVFGWEPLPDAGAYSIAVMGTDLQIVARPVLASG
ncbi:MAG TPA: hypothetical protein VMO26_29390 [Vicinamibacterales bacterium]|nr:hypothetical protein [Vicinamibacterales bacterium]